MSEKNNKYTPNLRFPEFSGEWEEKKLGEVVNSFKTGKLDANAMVEGGKYRFYTCAKDYSYIDSYAFEGDSIMIAGNGAHLGYVHHYDGKFNAYQRTYVLNNFKCDSNYLENCIRYYLPNRIRLEKKEGNMPYIVLSTLTDMTITTPPTLAEQRKIASCLSAMDELIAAQAEKVDALKEKKTGLMQQLFPQKGETTPRLRFPEFTGEWEVVLAKELCDINTGKSNTQDQVADGLYPFFIRSATPVRSNRYLYDCEAVITIGEGQIGKVFHYVNGKFDLHQRCYMMSNFKGIDCRYFYYFFSHNFYERVMRLSAKAVVDSVRLEMISDMPIFVPSTLAEQQKIASCLSALDDQIAAETEKLTALKDYKKGLMQQLLPQPAK